MTRRRYIISGQVQGVGFRPFAYRLARERGLSGHVRNAPEGVILEVQGQDPALDSFAAALENELPPLARVTALKAEPAQIVPGERGFAILASDQGAAHAVLISPDVATCADCLADFSSPGDRRFAYPFTNCTNCGPRYSITRSMPYDRPFTSMNCFELCPDCAAEYSDPGDRRFHAQPNACAQCGPSLFFTEADQAARLRPDPDNPGLPAGAEAYGGQALRLAAQRLAQGALVAVKGLGGFHLVCDASSSKAVRALRERKKRPHKPLAVMAASLEDAGGLARIGPGESGPLTSIERPIVLCPARQDSPLAPEIAPDTNYVGIMLPYTPLHHLLLKEFGAAARQLNPAPAQSRPAALVMTSGNRGGEPICLGNREALRRLDGIADAFLLHNRDILIRTDDSVVRPLSADPVRPEDPPLMFLRRARGYVPRQLPLPGTTKSAPILALGAELKNTVTVTRDDQAFVSQHIGDMRNMETLSFQEEIAAHLAKVLQVSPELCICDEHPDFASRALAASLGLPAIALQHHLAHAEAVLAENGFQNPALVLALDGSGYSPDGSVWGGELLYLHPAANVHERLGHLAQLRLPGGEAAILKPWRIAAAALYSLGLNPADPTDPALPWMPGESKTAALIPRMLEQDLNSPATSSAGRLFDAASALLGLCLRISYEGQAAIRLESAQGPAGECCCAESGQASAPLLPVPAVKEKRNGLLELDALPLLGALYQRRRAGVPAQRLARAFHSALASGLADLALAGAERRKAGHVGLSGGVMQNLSLLSLLRAELRARGLVPLLHQALPPNDGCISYGQAVFAARQRS